MTHWRWDGSIQPARCRRALDWWADADRLGGADRGDTQAETCGSDGRGPFEGHLSAGLAPSMLVCAVDRLTWMLPIEPSRTPSSRSTTTRSHAL